LASMKDKLASRMAPYGGVMLPDEELAAFSADVKATIEKLVSEQFEVVQFVRDSERAYFMDGLKKMLSGHSQAVADAVNPLADAIIDKIDIELAQPLRKGLEKVAPGFAAEAQKNKLFSYGPGRAASFAAMLQGAMTKRMDRYIRNEDTEDPSREVRLNKVQADYVTGCFASAVGEAIQAPVEKGALRMAFNAVSAPFRTVAQVLSGSPVKARMMKDLMYNVSAYMESQIVRGDRIAARLSGGQKKMLMAACVLLAKPDILLLDEIPTGLDAKNGLSVYKDIMDAIPKNATVISIIHHEEQFVHFHTLHARVANNTVTVTPITKAAPTAEPQKPQGPAPV
ncbi:MAG: ATP-binding cassette domain-containing protein, partial [Alphaproteobacteria bacterium]|nr:ATP-binding cassette domain-containing protein [Alphaproteobacteria bacterium]